ncbi:MAG: 3-dehydroquinate synthase [Gammaproteobacteria bacterium]|nr:3-dehydroquinate synthase [Gammaproteobacteria bacterium]
MSTLTVELAHHSYPIHVGPGLLSQPALLAPHIGEGGALVVTNQIVADLYLKSLRSSLGAVKHACVILPDGEEHKNLATLNALFDALVSKRFGRDATILALGGGVIGDMAGFAAACYQRGIEYVQLPTTLLAQVDSSVGGKTAVNHPAGKNMIGAFHQPTAVIADTNTLATLSDRELRCGLAEVIKYGLIRDAEFFSWLEANVEALLARDWQALTEAIVRSCRNKADVVAGDERERGERVLLNLGHTFAHAIETGLGHGQWLHGEAVAAGMHMAADLSARLGMVRQDVVARIRTLLSRVGLPVLAPASLDTKTMRALMSVDKKVKAGKLRLILLKSLGNAVVADEFSESALEATLDTCRQIA